MIRQQTSSRSSETSSISTENHARQEGSTVMLEKLFAKLIERHPDSLLQIRTHYSPGVPGKIKPFYYVSITVNGDLLYSSGDPKLEFPIARTADGALEQALKLLGA